MVAIETKTRFSVDRDPLADLKRRNTKSSLPPLKKAQKPLTEAQKMKLARIKQRLAKDNEARLRQMQCAGGYLQKGVEVRYQPV